MKTLTQTQLLAHCVPAHVVFFSFSHDDDRADAIVAVFRDARDIDTFSASHGRQIEYPRVYSQEVPLQGPAMPYEAWPEVATVYLVTEGGISDATGDTEIDPVALAVFVDREGAERFAAAEGNPNVVVREVPLDAPLPIPAWVTGSPTEY